MIFLLLLLPAVLSAVLALVVRPYHVVVGRINTALALVALGAALLFANRAITGGDVLTFGPGDILRADSLTVLLLLCITSVAVLTLGLSPGLGGETNYTATQLRRYQIFINLFIAAMLLAVSANNVGIMWIAIEATTIFSALLIPLTLTKTSVEASWKYILIGSVGIALAFVGTVLGYIDFVTHVAHAENALNWPILLASAPMLHPDVMRMAFVFILVGYGTKAGIAPMHTWKPDAYGEAPAPLGALMSSALFAVAMYAIVRWKIVIDATVDSSYSNTLLFALGMLSLLIGSFSMVLARNYKRMLAYSSVEHTGLICLGLGLGPLGVFAAFLHLVNHTLAKSLAFFLAGHIEQKYRSPLVANVRGLLKVMPWTGGLFAAVILVLVGLPPAGLFISEFALFRAGFSDNHPWLMAATLALLVVAFVAIINQMNAMLYGAPSEGVTMGDVSAWRIAPLLVSIVLLVVLGVTLPTPLATLLDQIVAIVSQT